MSIIERPSPDVATTHHSVADAVGAVPRRALARPTTRRQNVVLTLTATVLGLCFGFAAPSVSPVSPTPPAVTAPAVMGAAAVPADPAVPASPAEPSGPDLRRGQRDRFGSTDQQGRAR